MIGAILLPESIFRRKKTPSKKSMRTWLHSESKSTIFYISSCTIHCWSALYIYLTQKHRLNTYNCTFCLFRLPDFDAKMIIVRKICSFIQ